MFLVVFYLLLFLCLLLRFCFALALVLTIASGMTTIAFADSDRCFVPCFFLFHDRINAFNSYVMQFGLTHNGVRLL